MFQRQLLCAIAAGLCLAAAAGGQPADAALSASLRAHVQGERFGIVTSIRGLPLGVRDELQRLFGGALDIAEPGAGFQAAGARVDPGLPLRRLVAAGCSADHCLVYYERGGTAHTGLAALFHWTPEATRLEVGGAAPPGLASLDNLRGAILSGRIKGGAKVW